MSDVALLKAVEKKLRQALGDGEGKVVGLQPEGKPPPKMGLRYVGIDDAGYANNDTNPLSLDETYSVVVVVTAKLDYAPRDRAAQVLQLKGELRTLSRSVVLALHGQYDVLDLANDEIGNTANGFIEPLRLGPVSAVEPRGAEWVWAEASDTPPTVYAREIRFVGARRVQTLESAT